jgi:hypothetical protein
MNEGFVIIVGIAEDLVVCMQIFPLVLVLSFQLKEMPKGDLTYM